MATIKAYTDLNQSRKLAEILPLESADMHYNDWYYDFYDGYEHTGIYVADLGIPKTICGKLDIPCWSLAALLSVLPKYELNNFGDTIQLAVNLEALATEGDETLLDLVVNMIIHLHELNLL